SPNPSSLTSALLLTGLPHRLHSWPQPEKRACLLNRMESLPCPSFCQMHDMFELQQVFQLDRLFFRQQPGLGTGNQFGHTRFCLLGRKECAGISSRGTLIFGHSLVSPKSRSLAAATEI